jgi:hypothetical protein
MFCSIAQLAGAIALLPSLTRALPSERLASPKLEVPWKRSGLDTVERRNYDTCSNGPASRACWQGDFNIDTDMDLEWPDTGKTVTVRLNQPHNRNLQAHRYQYSLDIQNVTMAPDGFSKQMFAINGQFPGPVRGKIPCITHV